MIKFKKKGAGLMTWDAVCAVGLALIAVSVGVFGYREYITSSRMDVVKSDLATISSAVSQYHYEMDKYPDSLNDLTKSEDQHGPWLNELKRDPWNHDYKFVVSKDKKRYIVYSTLENGNTNVPDVNNPTSSSNKGNKGNGLYIMGK